MDRLVRASAMAKTVRGGIAKIGEAIVRAAGDGVPRGSSGTDVKFLPGLREQRAVFVEFVVGFVAPLQDHDILRNFFHQFRIMQDDVAPEMHRSPVLLNEFVDFQQEIEIDPAFADSLTFRFAPAFAEFPRFIPTDIEFLRRKIGQQLGVKFGQQFQRLRFSRI